MERINKIRALFGLMTATSLGSCGTNVRSLDDKYDKDDFAKIVDFEVLSNGEVVSTLSNKDSKNTNKVYIRIKSIDSSFVYEETDGNGFSKYLGMNEQVIYDEIERQHSFGNKVGLIIEPFDDTYDASYKAISLIKNIIENYQIELGVFYAPEGMEKHDANYSPEKKSTTYIATMYTILEMLSKNNIYTGLFVDAQDLKELTKVTNACIYEGYLDNYDKIIVNDKGEDLSNIGIHYSVEIDGRVYSVIDMADVIADANLNTKDGLKEDYIYVVKSGDTLTAIGQRFGITAEDIAHYNNVSLDKIIYPGDELYIPSVYLQGKKISTDLAKGIDISQFNIVNWDKVAPQIDFAIVRVLDTYVGRNGVCYDKNFVSNVSECKRLGIPLNLYYVTNATSFEDVEKEVEHVYQFMSKYGIENDDYIALYVDMENWYVSKYGEKAADFAQYAYELFKMYGIQTGCYYPGRFTNYFVGRYQGYHWIVDHKHYSDSTDFQKFKDKNYTQDNHLLDESNGVIGVQYCSKGKIDGVEGNVDIDYGLSKYLVTKEEENELEESKLVLSYDSYQ